MNNLILILSIALSYLLRFIFGRSYLWLVPVLCIAEFLDFFLYFPQQILILRVSVCWKVEQYS
jgi:uncharacterized protein YqhQ